MTVKQHIGKVREEAKSCVLVRLMVFLGKYAEKEVASSQIVCLRTPSSLCVWAASQGNAAFSLLVMSQTASPLIWLSTVSVLLRPCGAWLCVRL